MNEKIFKIDNPFFRVMGRLADYVILNFLFLLTSLPVLTAGASLAAMHGVIRLMREGREGALVKTYFKLWVKNLKSYTKLWVVLLITGCILSADFYIVFTAAGGTLQPMLLIIITAMLTLWLMIFSWSFVGMEESETRNITLIARLKKIAFNSIRYLPYTIAIMAVELIPLVVYQLSFQLFAAVLEPLYLLVGFSASSAICNRLTDRF